MKIAIHHSIRSFSGRWIDYCKEKGISYKLVNCYDSDIITQLKDCQALMWHYHHALIKDSLFAKQLLYALEATGIKVFPDFKTSWHFDDKLGQKYLLESLGAPLVKSYVFFDKKEALSWAANTNFPKVFKLRTGAGSRNVYLVRSRQEALIRIKRAFKQGFPQYDKFRDLGERISLWKMAKASLLDVAKSLRRLFLSTPFSKFKSPERGYIYFQDFIPGNYCDFRIVVINDKAFGLKRLVRKNDFRASGSGLLYFNKDEIDERCVRVAMDVSKKAGFQCMSYDFILDKENKPLITEISYGFPEGALDSCEGYWDDELKWYKGPFNFYGWMVDTLNNGK